MLLPAPIELPCRPGHDHLPAVRPRQGGLRRRQRFGDRASFTAGLHLLCGTSRPAPAQTLRPARCREAADRPRRGRAHASAGSAITVDVNPGTPSARTLFDVPAGTSTSRAPSPSSPARIEPGDTLRVTCRHSQRMRDVLPELEGSRSAMWCGVRARPTRCASASSRSPSRERDHALGPPGPRRAPHQRRGARRTGVGHARPPRRPRPRVVGDLGRRLAGPSVGAHRPLGRGLPRRDRRAHQPRDVLTRPLDGAGFAEVVGKLGELVPSARAGFLVSPFPTPDLTRHGLALVGHPPLMVRFPGGQAPPLPRGSSCARCARRGARRRRARPGRGLPDARPPLSPARSSRRRSSTGRPGSGWRTSTGNRPRPPRRTWPGDAVLVEYVAALPTARGRGAGAAVTWAATLAEPVAAGGPGGQRRRPAALRTDGLPRRREVDGLAPAGTVSTTE